MNYPSVEMEDVLGLKLVLEEVVGLAFAKEKVGTDISGNEKSFTWKRNLHRRNPDFPLTCLAYI